MTPATRTSPLARKGRAAAARTDAEVIAACLRGDERGWTEMVARYGRLVYSIARRHGLGEADAQDIFQQVFTIAHRRLGSLRDAARLPSWLITTTIRECRHARPWLPRRGSLDACVAPSEPPLEETVQWERQHLVRQALRRLGAKGERLMLALFSCTGRPDYQQIARDLGIRPGSIGPTRARLFRKLEKILVELGVDRLDAGGAQRDGWRIAG